MRWLALDVGTRRVGVAVCDAGETVTTPLAALTFGSAEQLAVRVAALAGEREIGGIVVGLPVTLAAASRGEQRVRAVVAALARLVAVPVVTVDERGTTAVAEERLREAGVPARRLRSVVDSVAAQVILDDFLARRKRSG